MHGADTDPNAENPERHMETGENHIADTKDEEEKICRRGGSEIV
jgi:hypothetical protein